MTNGQTAAMRTRLSAVDDMAPGQGGGEPLEERISDTARYPLPDDIDIVPPAAPLPLSRGATERKLQRTDRYDRSAEVTAYETLTPTGTVLIDFRVIDREPFDFPPGHFVGIRAEVGQKIRRSPYCISSPPTADGTFRLLIRLVPEGPLSLYLGSLRPGDVISFRGPSGRSMLPKGPDDELVFLVTGVGIGPVLSLAHSVLPGGFRGRIQVFWGLRQVEDVCLVDELDELAARYPNFTYRISLSQPPPGWTGLRGRVTETVPPLLPTLGGKQYFLVGNGAMIEEFSTALSDAGVDKVMIYEEPYFNVRHRPDPRVVADIRSRFVASDLFSPYAHQQAGLYLPTGSDRRVQRSDARRSR